MITKQKYYDMLVEAAMDGTFPSYEVTGGEGISCLYRGAGKRRCAIGLLIADHKYKPAMEGVTIYDLCCYEQVDGLLVRDLNKVQVLHDALAKDCHVHERQWDGKEFIQKLNQLPFFLDVQQVDPGKISLQDSVIRGVEGITSSGGSQV